MRPPALAPLAAFTTWLLAVGVLSAGEPAEIEPAKGIAWISDYAEGIARAEKESRMLLVYFRPRLATPQRSRFESETLADPQVRERMREFVCVRVTTDARVRIDGQRVRLLDHPAFDEMLGQPGVAIIDMAHKDAAYYGDVVSTFPWMEKHWYTPDRMAVVLDLPPGTLTQRTLIYAVRVHPERPQSTDGSIDSNLLDEAESHSRYQASIRRQGHHHWDSRFQRIRSRLPCGLNAAEVCAESWPSERLVEAAIECVRCWRLSPGHWEAVRTLQALYGYDMKRGDNGIWYATGIFGEGTILAEQPASKL